MIPTSSNYPNELDTDTNLYVVHDALRVTLADDYNPGDTTIIVSGGNITLFPDKGIITLTDQCEEISKRALSFYYESRTDYSFDELEILPEFEDLDAVKPKGFTHVTLNVVAAHHDNLKDALIAIEEFVGVKGTLDVNPYGDTLEGRINFIRKLAFTPKAWFKTVGVTTGVIPLNVSFQSESIRLGPGEVIYIWDFGDDTSSTISISGISDISGTASIFECVGTASTISCINVEKTYTLPAKYDVSLTISNIYGSDTVIFEDLINARIAAPDEAVIKFLTKENQLGIEGYPADGPYSSYPTIRSSVNTFIDIEIPSGTNPNTGKSYAGEELDGADNAIDPIVTYTWSLGDDLTHASQSTARALYTVGGIYDLRLRVDTNLDAYRITNYKSTIDIVELTNLWLWTFDTIYGDNAYNLQTSGNTTAYEFGLISETFKTGHTSLNIIRDDEFFESDDWKVIQSIAIDQGYDIIAQAKREFRRNISFAPRGTTTSGDLGQCVLYYATGGAKNSSIFNQSITTVEYNAFLDTYTLGNPSVTRPWNWLSFSSTSKTYFLLGQSNNSHVPMTNPTLETKTTYDLNTMTSSDVVMTIDDYQNGSWELMQHVSVYDPSTGYPINGWFATYRSAWKDNSGFFLRNDGVGTFFRIKSFYKTQSTLSEDFVNITKLLEMSGPTKLEGQLVPLTSGLFFFNNSGSISAYNDTTGIWETGGPSADSVAFMSVQDATVSGFNSASNTLLATSNGDYVAYLSYDYSRNAFVKFNAQDLTFKSVQQKPSGNQFIMGVY